MVFFSGMLVDRLSASYISICLKNDGRFWSSPHRRKNKDEQEVSSLRDSEFDVSDQESDERRESIVSEALASNIANVIALFATIVVIAAFVDLFILLGVEFFEIIVPNYIVKA
jgi:hypothetical protein